MKRAIAGAVYVMDNFSIPNQVKIGQTAGSVLERARTLSRTSAVATPFRVLFYYDVSDVAVGECLVHRSLRCRRVRHGREFFWVTKDELGDLQDLMTVMLTSVADDPKPKEVQRDDLFGEESVVWLEDPSALPYVRESVIHHVHRQSRPRWQPGRMIGYTTQGPGPSSEHGRFTRRVFWLKPYDRSEDPHGPHYRDCAPTEAVAPASIVLGKRGTRLDR
ncbi:DUF6009 family protein [Nocardia sp. NPDC051052]|uniref:DUF6009 family protein n=1 Tax=Nocardia sp. NPDC051052 TaxID=3364322 RepID=UPI0037A6C607